MLLLSPDQRSTIECNGGVRSTRTLQREARKRDPRVVTSSRWKQSGARHECTHTSKLHDLLTFAIVRMATTADL